MILVLDASAAAELLIGSSRGRAAERVIGDAELYAPAHLAVEVLSVLCGWVLSREVTADRARIALADLDALGVHWMDLPPLLGAAWQLRDNVSAYDAVYVALAEALDCPPSSPSTAGSRRHRRAVSFPAHHAEVVDSPT